MRLWHESIQQAGPRCPEVSSPEDLYTRQPEGFACYKTVYDLVSKSRRHVTYYLRSCSLVTGHPFRLASHTLDILRLFLLEQGHRVIALFRPGYLATPLSDTNA